MTLNVIAILLYAEVNFGHDKMIRKLAYFFLVVSIVSLVMGILSRFIRFNELKLEDYDRIAFVVVMSLYLIFELKFDWATLRKSICILINIAFWISVALVWSTTNTRANSGDPGIEIAIFLLLASLFCFIFIFFRNLAIASWLIILGIHIITTHNFNMSIRGG